MKYIDACEAAYKNGYAKALEEASLRQAICDGTQKTAFHCTRATRAICSKTGDCAYCEAIAHSIRKAKGLE